MANPIPQVGGAVVAPDPVAAGAIRRYEERLGRVLEDDTVATMSFGALCLEQGVPDEAAQIFLRLVKKNPGDARVRERLDEALRAKTQKRKGGAHAGVHGRIQEGTQDPAR